MSALTILVGANASGKSNIIEALGLRRDKNCLRCSIWPIATKKWYGAYCGFVFERTAYLHIQLSEFCIRVRPFRNGV
ncbi:MAG: ATP-binding protein [Saprospiraceae bacterium]|nr:ATP-binding protein [Saprospiraceae bacterium]